MVMSSESSEKDGKKAGFLALFKISSEIKLGGICFEGKRV